MRKFSISNSAFAILVSIILLSACRDKESQNGQGTELPYWEDIQNFKKMDSIQHPPGNAILFIGSSSFTLWNDVQDYFPGYTIINRGFGGSTLEQQVFYANDIIFPYKPRQIVIYCGENDLAFDSVSATEVFDRFNKLFVLIREKLSDVPIIYISMKPSPSRRHLIPAMLKGNQLIKDFLTSQKNTVYINVHDSMLNASHEPIPEIFRSDSLHMNAKGYLIWQKAIMPYLIKNQ